MRPSIIAWLMSCAILTGGSVLGALAHDLTARPRDRCTMTFPIEPRHRSMIREAPAADLIAGAKRSPACAKPRRAPAESKNASAGEGKSEKRMLLGL